MASGRMPANILESSFSVIKANNKLLIFGLGIALLFPLFFQISGGVYMGFLLDSGGSIRNLPLPIAVLACFGGMATLIVHSRRAYVAITFIASMLVVMLVSVLFAGSELQFELRKLILLAQFVMPMLALALGQMIMDDDKVIPKAFLLVLLVIVPLQLLAGWMQGTLTLTHSMYLFSIYQHFQYVPLVFVAAFAYATVTLWGTHKTLLLFLLPLMFIYVIASVSFLSIAAFIIFVSIFVDHRLRQSKKIHGISIPLIVIAVVTFSIIGIAAYFAVAKNKTSIIGDNGQYIGKFLALSDGRLPVNVSERIVDWRLFGSGIIESPRTMILGHAVPLAREVRTSAHNWYIDIVYTFGFISLLPVFVLIGYTVYLLWRSRNVLTLEVWCLAFIVFYLVVVDSNFKVTLRQPYSGIFTYFLWGLLLSRLRSPTISKTGA